MIAKVNGSKITRSDLQNRIKSQSAKFDKAELTVAANFNSFRDQALESIIQERILLAEADRQDIEVGDAEIEAETYRMTGIPSTKGQAKALRERGIDPDMWYRAQKTRLIIDKLVEHEVFDKAPISDEEIEKHYKRNKRKFVQPVQYRARQIVVDTRQQAEDVLKRIKAGEKFAKLAEENSLSPDSKRGGDLGYFDTSAYPKIFTDVCKKLKVGETSEVVVTDYGYQIFMLIDKSEKKMLPLDDVKNKIRRLLSEDKAEELFTVWFNGLRSNADVSIDVSALTEVSLDEKE